MNILNEGGAAVGERLRAQKLTQHGIHKAAEIVGCEPALIAAILEIEAPQGGFDPMGRVVIMTEPAHVWKRLTPAERSAVKGEGVDLGKWVKKWRGRSITKKGYYGTLVGYQHDAERAGDQRWDILEAIAAVDHEAALLGTSWGLGQIMGFNYERAGYQSVGAMVQAFGESEDNQVIAVGRFLASSGLGQAFTDRDFQAIAAHYNGPGNVPVYSAKLEDAYNRQRDGKRDSPDPGRRHARLRSTRIGSSGDEVKEIQRRLSALGYHVDADGYFGQRTEDQVLLFQLHNGLARDGVVGPQTRSALARAEPLPMNERPWWQIVGSNSQANAGLGQAAVATTAIAGGIAHGIAEQPTAQTPVTLDNVAMISGQAAKIAGDAQVIAAKSPSIMAAIVPFGWLVIGVVLLAGAIWIIRAAINGQRLRLWS